MYFVMLRIQHPFQIVGTECDTGTKKNQSESVVKCQFWGDGDEECAVPTQLEFMYMIYVTHLDSNWLFIKGSLHFLFPLEFRKKWSFPLIASSLKYVPRQR